MKGRKEGRKEEEEESSKQTNSGSGLTRRTTSIPTTLVVRVYLIPNASDCALVYLSAGRIAHVSYKNIYNPKVVPGLLFCFQTEISHFLLSFFLYYLMCIITAALVAGLAVGHSNSFQILLVSSCCCYTSDTCILCCSVHLCVYCNVIHTIRRLAKFIYLRDGRIACCSFPKTCPCVSLCVCFICAVQELCIQLSGSRPIVYISTLSGIHQTRVGRVRRRNCVSI